MTRTSPSRPGPLARAGGSVRTTAEAVLAERWARLVAAVVALAVVVQVVAALLLGGTGPLSAIDAVDGPVPWAHGPVLLGLLLALTVAGDLVAVRVRRGDEVEELTLFEAAVVVDVLLLPVSEALLVPVAASLVCSAVRRRGLVKALFNAADLALASAASVLVVHAVATPGEGLTTRTVLALVLGTLVFATVNLLAVSAVLAAVAGGGAGQAVRSGLRLTALTAVGTVGIGGTLVTTAWASPAMLPFALMPALALTVAYRSAAQEAEEHARSGRLLALSHVLAGRLDADELLTSFLPLAREAFRADVAVAVLDAPDGSGAPVAVLDDAVSGPGRRPALPSEVAALAARDSGPVPADALEPGWARAVVAPLEAGGQRLGVVVLATRDRRARLGTRELSLLTPLASALAVGLRGSEHLQRLVEETSKLKAVVEQSSDGILVLDGAGVVQLWSPALVELSGIAEQEAVGRLLGAMLDTTTVADGQVDAFEVGRRELSPGTPTTTVELVLRRDDGDLRTLRCAHAGVFDDEDRLTRDVVLVHDVTRERHVERLKTDFIATVSHELRTPVTPIKGYADLLRRRGDKMSAEQREECLSVIIDRAGHLARLVEDLLLASRISATGSGPQALDLAPVDLLTVVRRAAADFGDDSARVRVSGTSAVVRADPVRTVQVLTNLVGNALKYSAAGSQVDVRVVVRDGLGVVEVQDHGRGIPADHVGRVFDKFHRVEDPMRMTTGGTGLGLYIARQLAEAMHGRLTCTSVLGVGSTFTMELPLSTSAAATTGPTGSPETPPRSTGPAPAQVPAGMPRPRHAPPWVLSAPHAAGAAQAERARTLG